MKVIKAVQTKGYGYGMYSELTIDTECFQNIRILLNKVAETTVFVICVREVPGSNVGRATVYLASVFFSLSSGHPGKYRDSIHDWAHITYFDTLLNSSVTCRPAIRRQTV
jgi:hypothetical protein